jgi:hypothetical protein
LTGVKQEVSLSCLTDFQWFDSLYNSSLKGYEPDHDGGPSDLYFFEDWELKSVPLSAMFAVISNNLVLLSPPIMELSGADLQNRFLAVLSHFFQIDISECRAIEPPGLGKFAPDSGATSELSVVLVDLGERFITIDGNTLSYPDRVVKTVAFMVESHKAGKRYFDRKDLLKSIGIADSKKDLKDLLHHYESIWVLVKGAMDSEGHRMRNKFVFNVDPVRSSIVR